MNTLKQFALITGASSGIGQATAEAFADLGINLLICGRRRDRLEALQQKLCKTVQVECLVFDVCNREAVQTAISQLPADVRDNIRILVNNAGGAHGLDAIQDGHYQDWEQMLDSNVKGLLYVSEAIIPILIKHRQGHIVNLSSVAGKETYPKGNVYCASKRAVEALSQGMRMDLLPYGIKVTNIAPGAVNTEFSAVRFRQDQTRADSVYQGFTPLVARDVAETIAFVVSRPVHVNLADIVILPAAQAAATVFHKVLD
jgi:3-hydroxy acid dehydrogenase / malonic semialdehyde reductase